jgi:hypothetical protein
MCRVLVHDPILAFNSGVFIQEPKFPKRFKVPWTICSPGLAVQTDPKSTGAHTPKVQGRAVRPDKDRHVLPTQCMLDRHAGGE